ncbi:MAG: ATP-dependent Clp protease ATP-binding subunit [Clostridiales bacterium]|nr:ATP-dependent Clp protease ATP-binding subunit [Clostridiales bacterium]
MYYETFSRNVNQVIEYATALSKRYGLRYIGSEHILFGLINVSEGRAAAILREEGVTNERFIYLFEKTIDKRTVITGNMFTARTKRVFENAVEISLKARAGYVGTEHLLLAVLIDSDSIAVAILNALKVNVKAVIEGLSETLFDGIDEEEEEEQDQLASAYNVGRSASEQRAKAEKTSGKDDLGELSKFGVNLNKQAEDGKLDPVIGRKTEIDRVIQILSRRTKNNPVLIGEPGVGKSAVVEGLAQAIVKGNVPELLADKIVFSLDIAGMLAGARYRGDFEERLKKIIDTVKQNGRIILFIDEIHNIVGAGSTGEGNMDAANILKPMLSRGELQTIGATTIDEYRKYIEKDAALERRFQPVMVEAPSVEDTIEILKGLRDKYESHHGVIIPDEAIVSAVTLSDRYINDRFLPDKAIDLIDEASSRVKLDSYNSPFESKQKENELNSLIAQQNDASRRKDFKKAMELDEEISKAREELEKIKIANQKNNGDRDRLMLTSDDIAKVVSNWTGVPVVKLNQSEAQQLLDLEEVLHKRVIGQYDAVRAVSDAIRRARAGLKDPNRPVGSFIFVGPTGVGKTELSKALAETVFGNENSIIRVDMSEYMEKHSVSKMVGAPPGYIGFDEAGQLTEKVRRKPYSVVLFDEIEKAHPDVFNLMLQLLDDGRLTDSKGRVVSFKNCIIIMTSNVGATEVQKKATLGFAGGGSDRDYENMCDKYMDALKEKFRPEFLNRIDDIIVFHKLEKEDTAKIAEILLSSLRKRLALMEITLEITPKAMDLITEKGYDSNYGARPLKRVIQRNIEDKLSEEILRGRVKENSKVVIDANDNEFIFDCI